MTINKFQGQTIHNVDLYLPQYIFSHRQLYVALSRGISMYKTKVLVIIEQPKCQNGTYTKNIVYKEVLGMITPFTYTTILTWIINYLLIVYTNNIILLEISDLEV
ncbi:hypothetical protein EJD97_005748 [Solanum chilense]|uniref:ATP-dependent DNA helicase n=1 Tax=Solanum chilense TaxID=4083 RepID=A0A6N2AJQ4_SOLCI|nr:hypothetical protein EJD97_005748 [Solanum chilense]